MSIEPKHEKVILVVDDMSCNRSVVKFLIETNTDFKVISSENGMDAVTVFMSRPVSMILMDIEMPVMNGYTATRIIRNLRAGAGIPIIAITANDQDSDTRRCLNAGCTEYLSKPIDRNRLLDVIHRHLETSVLAE